MTSIRYLAIVLLLAIASPMTLAQEGGQGADVRVLIDISGSMKKNDPGNLRRPALRLLVGLLPDQSRAGVWSFGQYVNMLVPLGQVDAAWRERARQQAAKIHSRGLFTHIEAAIARATGDWKAVDGNYQRHVILLTDGVVDVSKVAEESAASRRRILEQQLPLLQQQGVRVHTVALSERADHELMQQLSDATGGWYEQVNEAARLQRIFLRLFERVGKPDTVPLKENRFHIDSQINEATLLVFKAPDAPPTRVHSPDGKSFAADNVPPNVTWHRDQGYDMLTITAPQPGEWRIEAALDPDNRVMVVTDLKMRVAELPARMAIGEQLPVEVYFTENGDQISEPAFLDVVALSSELNTDAGPGEPRPIVDDGQAPDATAGDGLFTQMLGDGIGPGRVSLVINAAGKTFQRQRQLAFELLPPATFDVVVDEADGDLLNVRVRPDGQVLAVDSVVLEGVLHSTTGDTLPLLLAPREEGLWEGVVDPAELEGHWRLEVTLNARTLAGNALQLAFKPHAIDGRKPPPAPAEEPAEEPVMDPPSPPPVTDDEPDWTMQASIFGAGNLVALLLVGLVAWIVRRRAAKNRITLLEEDEESGEANQDEGVRGEQ